MSERANQYGTGRGQAQRGLSLVELMVALVIGTILVGGALTLFVKSKASYRQNEQINAMQDVSRFSHHVLVSDLRLAGYWGDTNAASSIEGSKDFNPLSTAVANDCYDYEDLGKIVEGSNNADPYTGAGCIPSSDYQGGTDILIVRHALPGKVTTTQKGEVYVRGTSSGGTLFVAGVDDPGSYAGGDVRPASMTVYYVRPYTDTPGDNEPCLRMKTLGVSGTTPTMTDQEVASGVQQFQVQFGIDTTGDGSVNEYVNPGNVPSNTTIVAVRFWVLVRADKPDQNYNNNLTYTLAGNTYQFNDHYRRLLQVDTVQLRNAVISAQ
ncbi:MAG TPA: PilW family protein [Gammaproteobacteria bacterium]|nr:PilW family protein [Gammaproteobacteria bacterium]